MATLVKALAGQPKPRPSEPSGISKPEPDVEDQMQRGHFQDSTLAERLTLSHVINRYLTEATPTKETSTQPRPFALLSVAMFRPSSHRLSSSDIEISS